MDLQGLRKLCAGVRKVKTGWEEAICEGTLKIIAAYEKLQAERDKLQRFKDWVHAYLDQQGVPHHPPGVHGAEGCRIGDRMDWLMQYVMIPKEVTT